ncbi:MAG: type I phosphomannose isomerase catalytic subunit [Verrucomicrobiota bacterium]
MLYPLMFQPIFKERVWGGRRMEQLYAKPLPPGVPIGESWEITDRPEGVSVVSNGPLAGQTLRWLMENHARELLGGAKSQGGRFPLLVKILDAQEKLSLQVHPPAGLAQSLGGEPKTEMWYITDAAPDAEIFVGLKRGVTRAEFERRVQDGTVAQCFHRHAVHAGDSMFLPSGRVHALGAGPVLFEIQQNSDTTYRVFDWNRVGLDGKPRELHVAQALASIDFTDFEPPLVSAPVKSVNGCDVQRLVDDALFTVELSELPAGGVIERDDSVMQVIGVVNGALRARGGGQEVMLKPGAFCLLPAECANTVIESSAGATFLCAEAN